VRSGCSPPPRPRGFVLVAVLVLLVVIGLLAGAVATVSERAVAAARADSEAFEAELATIGTRDTLLFMLTTQRQTFAGLTVDEQVVWSIGQAAAVPASDGTGGDLPPPLPVGNEIRLDGTPYQGLGSVRFALQDDAGLFSPNWTFDLYRPGFYQRLGVPPADWDALEDQRLDYQDPDTLRRLNGAEAGQYRREKLPPPRNAPLVTPLELRRVLGWREALGERDDASIMSLLTASRVASLNINTAPPEVLQSLPGVDGDTAARIVALRERLPFMLSWQFLQEFALPLDEFAPIGLLPVGYGTLSLWHNEAGPLRVVHWTLTPTDAGGRPWRLDYEIVLPRDPALHARLARQAQTPLLAGPAADRR
jgi:general secretion pathway protein K